MNTKAFSRLITFVVLVTVLGIGHYVFLHQNKFFFVVVDTTTMFPTPKIGDPIVNFNTLALAVRSDEATHEFYYYPKSNRAIAVIPTDKQAPGWQLYFGKPFNVEYIAGKGKPITEEMITHRWGYATEPHGIASYLLPTLKQKTFTCIADNECIIK